MTPALSIVIVGYGNRADTERCLGSIEVVLAGSLGREIELVLVDNASPDDTRTLFSAWADRATVVLLDENRNFAGGYNAGARAARGEALLLLNNDTELLPGAVEALLDALRDASVGVAGARLLYPTGRIQHAGWGWWRREPAGTGFHLFHHEPGSLPPATASYDLDAVTGACMAIRRELFLAHQGFDEAFRNGWEDVDLCFRLRREGKRVVYRGDAAIVHHEGRTTGGRYDDGNRVLFESRWGVPERDDADRIARLFGASFWRGATSAPVEVAPAGSLFSVEGALTSLHPAADDARELLAVLEGDGWSPAARERGSSCLAPALSDTAWAVLHRAESRPRRPDALRIVVGDATAPDGAIVRALAPPEHPERARMVWAATAELAAELARELGPDRVGHLPWVLPPIAPSLAGGGLVVALPAAERRACALLEEVAALGVDVPVAVAPAVAGEGIVAMARAVLPNADLRPATSTAGAFAAVAAGADVVVCDDPVGRRALAAAATGATVTDAAGARDALERPLPRESLQAAAAADTAAARQTLRELAVCALLAQPHAA